MGFPDSIKACFSKYTGFSGRSARPEFWWFVLFVFVGTFVLSIVDSLIWGATESATKIFAPLFQLATFLPLLAVGWRRLHDTGKPGWYLLLPMLVSLAFVLALLTGVFAFGALEVVGTPEEQLRGPAAFLGVTGMIVSGIVQLVLAVLMTWWLTRPSEPGANAYGAPPS
jgi:uncharacterized membrane protein YhaH (DUF805 family)